MPTELSPVQLNELADAIVDRLASRLASVDADQLLDVHGAAELLSCSVPTIERLTKSGEIPSCKYGRLRRYHRGKLLEAHSTRGGQ